MVASAHTQFSPKLFSFGSTNLCLTSYERLKTQYFEKHFFKVLKGNPDGQFAKKCHYLTKTFVLKICGVCAEAIPSPSILVISQKIFGKKHPFFYGELQFLKEYKSGAKEILMLVYL